MIPFRSHYFFPPRSWRQASLRCNCAVLQFNPRDPVFVMQAAFPARAELRLAHELNGGEIIANPYGQSCTEPHGEPQRTMKC